MGQPFSFSGASTVCTAEVPTIVITFANAFPQLAGMTGTLTMADLNGNVVSTQPLVYQPNTTVSLLYPGTRVNPDGSIADVPGWVLNSAGFWVRDPSDEFLRNGIVLTYVVNPTATATVTYPPESSACANPNGPFPPPGDTATTRVLPPNSPNSPDSSRSLAFTGSDAPPRLILGFALLASGALVMGMQRRRRRD